MDFGSGVTWLLSLEKDQSFVRLRICEWYQTVQYVSVCPKTGNATVPHALCEMAFHIPVA